MHQERRRQLQQRRRRRNLQEATEEPYNPHLLFSGNLRDDLGSPVKDAQVQFWHADYHGNYFHPDDPLDGNELLTESFSYFGTATTDADGAFDFRTYRPGIYVSRPVTHIHFKVFYEGEELLTSQFYFEDEGVARWYDEMVILSLEEGVDEDGNVVLSTYKEVVVNMGTGGYQKRTPWDVEGPFYPLVDFFDVGNDMTSGLLLKFYTNETLSPTSEPTRTPTRKPTSGPSPSSEQVDPDLGDALYDILVDLQAPDGDDGNYTWNLDDEEALIVDFPDTMNEYDNENFTTSMDSNDEDNVENERVDQDDVEGDNGEYKYEHSDEEDDVHDINKEILFSPDKNSENTTSLTSTAIVGDDNGGEIGNINSAINGDDGGKSENGNSEFGGSTTFLTSQDGDVSSSYESVTHDALELPMPPENAASYDEIRLPIKDRHSTRDKDDKSEHKLPPGTAISRGVFKERVEEENSGDEDSSSTVEESDLSSSKGKRFLRTSK